MADEKPTQPKEEEIKDDKKTSEKKEENQNNDGISPLEEARKLRDENTKLLSELRKERERIEKASAEMLISGKSFNSQRQKEETADEKWAKEAKLRYAGTGMDPT